MFSNRDCVMMGEYFPCIYFLIIIFLYIYFHLTVM